MAFCRLLLLLGFWKKYSAKLNKMPKQNLRLTCLSNHLPLFHQVKKPCLKSMSIKKHCLLNGLDDIDYLVDMKEEIEAFEKTK